MSRTTPSTSTTATTATKSGVRVALPGQQVGSADVAANFADIAPPLSAGEAFAESARCLYCYDAPCTNVCPTHIDVPAFIKKIHSGNLRGAARVILDANPMGHSCARACPVEVLCEGACVMNEAEHRPIQIARLQRHATDALLERGFALFTPAPPSGKKVAVVGGGPAGLACAQELRRHGHDVVIYDAHAKPGGLNTYGIAQYKLTPEAALAEADTILKLGVTFRGNTVVGRDVAFDDLVRDHDALFIGFGLGATNQLGIPGEDKAGVIDALSFIEHLKDKPYGAYRVPDRVLVIGAGNTAVDAATQARRLGAREVAFVYRRGPDEASAYAYEMELARNDGCLFHFWATPLEVVGGAHVDGLKVKTPDGEQVLAAGMVIKAIGQEKQGTALRGFGVAVDDKGRAVVDAQRKTSRAKVWAGGDCVNGGKEIVNAAEDGKQAARAIHASFA
ncbi:MAG: NAD(P)-dependent oxidoreductase [Deltaproteobacteria bacterium]|nr:NAD(P)-dependent oxidoreductase [Deltaproteobacteria bacterium]